jgi:pimeloyl-ACP methyl ester carboxylesterase
LAVPRSAPAALWLTAALLGAGCGTVPERFDRAAAAAGLQRSEIAGLGFSHALYRPSRANLAKGPLHVYLTGDGRPHIRPTLPARDPTPRRPVVLDLMALDPAPRLLLGRPCYHGLAGAPGCGPYLWTLGRYGEDVVASMAAALERLAPEGRPIVLIGFSGGGALAVLLARRLPQVVGVVTLAGNLDPDAWTDLRGHSRLSGSLNPTAGGALRKGLAQHHYAGAEDRNVPPYLVRRSALKLGGRVRVLADTSHARGWSRHWPALLDGLRGGEPDGGPHRPRGPRVGGPG